MLKRKRLGREIQNKRNEGWNIRPIYNSEYNISLFELIKNIFNNNYD